MSRQKRIPIIAALAVLAVLFFRCGGGGSASAPAPAPGPDPGPGPSPIKAVVMWEAPQAYTDNTPLVPSRDLQGFEIYLRQDPNFGPADDNVAIAPPAATSYDLAPLVNRGATYYVSIRVVTAYDTKSDFSPPVSFSTPP